MRYLELITALRSTESRSKGALLKEAADTIEALLKDRITYEERAKIYADAADTFGRDIQTIVAIEELSELIKELCKVERLEGRLGSLAEEIADATIMLEQLRALYDVNDLVCAFMDSKVTRLAERVEQAKGGA